MNAGRPVWSTPIIGANGTLYVALQSDKVISLQAVASVVVTFVANGLPTGDYWNLSLMGTNYTTNARQLHVQVSVAVPVGTRPLPLRVGPGAGTNLRTSPAHSCRAPRQWST